ncbi:sugar phosphate isomerase/epimerase family protein [Bacillus horti]|uniref:Sugar phosphate isomerase/epimerase n=1 Tax=Caldalkalibacillus horti TaxID=77523 RepID=A0ABT9W584_9BACI|nr:sugar phosphate isomerase/epimerase [Bacillus horti]MDQ0168412.1 sugar phosphate isomerase/epimerase [Bacillus horti]
MESPSIGIQLYTLRDELNTDFAGTLKKVKEIGYSNVELAGYGGYEAKELRTLLNELGLSAISSHVSLVDLEGKLSSIIEYNLEIGSQFLVCPWLPEEKRKSRDDYYRLGEVLNKVGEQCSAHKLQLLYHNHEFEFERFNGQFGLDILLENTDSSLVQLELDTYWAEYAGVSAVEYLERNANRCRTIHIKDMADTPEKEFTELGNGTIDIPAILQASVKLGVDCAFVEQDVCKRSPLESIAISFDYLKKLGAV